MNKKGFTLVELLAVLVVLGLLIALITPTVNNLLKDSEETLAKEQINEIINATKKYAVENSDILPRTSTNTSISIETLIENGVIENSEVINPKTKEKLTGCVIISYNSNYNQYEYTFTNECE